MNTFGLGKKVFIFGLEIPYGVVGGWREIVKFVVNVTRRIGLNVER
jgi:hypothetical protein